MKTMIKSLAVVTALMASSGAHAASFVEWTMTPQLNGDQVLFENSTLEMFFINDNTVRLKGIVHSENATNVNQHEAGWMYVNSPLTDILLRKGDIHTNTVDGCTEMIYAEQGMMNLLLMSQDRCVQGDFFVDINLDTREVALTTVPVSPVPVPAAGLMLLTALGAGAMLRRRKS